MKGKLNLHAEIVYSVWDIPSLPSPPRPAQWESGDSLLEVVGKEISDLDWLCCEFVVRLPFQVINK